MSLAQYVKILGRGPSKSRHLTREEASDAMSIILKGEAEAEAIGALMMLMRYRGEDASELAGFVDAMRMQTKKWQSLDVDLDWPSYSAGRSRGWPWYLMAAKILAGDGTKLIIHGWNSNQQNHANPRKVLGLLGIPFVTSHLEAKEALQQINICYIGLEDLAPDILELLKLRDALGLRSPINSCLRLLNPTLAETIVQGVFHPAFLKLQQEASVLLDQKQMAVIKGGGGEFEVSPIKPVAIYHVTSNQTQLHTIPNRADGGIRMSELGGSVDDFEAIWRNEHADVTIEELVVGTCAAALIARGQSQSMAMSHARQLWKNRNPSKAA